MKTTCKACHPGAQQHSYNLNCPACQAKLEMELIEREIEKVKSSTKGELA